MGLTQRFLMGLAGLIVRIAHSEGLKTLKIALFEDQRFPAGVEV
jgi:hypothetical protein